MVQEISWSHNEEIFTMPLTSIRQFGVSIDTLQNWEQGRRRPEGPALALLKIAESNPETVMSALHA